MKISITNCFSILLLTFCFISPVNAKVQNRCIQLIKSKAITLQQKDIKAPKKNNNTLGLNKVTPNFILENNSILKIINLVTNHSSSYSLQKKKLPEQQFKQFNIIVDKRGA